MAKMFKTAYTVSYESENHWSVITQMTGSVWCDVLPYCIFNVVVMVILTILDHHTAVVRMFHLNMSKTGHGLVSLVVAFLLVSRVNIAMARYASARDGLMTMVRQTKEMSQAAYVLIHPPKDNTSSSAKGIQEIKEWRVELCYRTLLLLRTCMAVIDFPTTGVPPWDIPQLSGEEKEDVRKFTLLSTALSSSESSVKASMSQLRMTLRQLAHSERTEWEETMRVPIRVAYLLRKTVSRAQKYTTPMKLPILLNHVDGFMNGYYTMRTFLTTPVPFPLIQMARTFLFLYVFTIPFVMLSDGSSVAAHCFVVFVLTYGFVGLETVAIQLDDPFGDDPNDFDNNTLAMRTYEDVFYLIYHIDGQEWADKVQKKMNIEPNKDRSKRSDRGMSWYGGAPVLVGEYGGGSDDE